MPQGQAWPGRVCSGSVALPPHPPYPPDLSVSLLGHGLLAGVKPMELTEEAMRTYVRENAGKAFEHMVEAANADRAAAGLCTIEELK